MEEKKTQAVESSSEAYERQARIDHTIRILLKLVEINALKQGFMLPLGNMN